MTVKHKNLRISTCITVAQTIPLRYYSTVCDQEKLFPSCFLENHMHFSHLQRRREVVPQKESIFHYKGVCPFLCLPSRHMQVDLLMHLHKPLLSGRKRIQHWAVAERILLASTPSLSFAIHVQIHTPPICTSIARREFLGACNASSLLTYYLFLTYVIPYANAWEGLPGRTEIRSWNHTLQEH